MKTARTIGALVLFAALASGCSSTQPGSPRAGEPDEPSSLQNPPPSLSVKLMAMDLANKTLVEWQVARLAAACDEVAHGANPPAARREALRLKAAYAASAYSIASGPNPLAHVLDLTALAVLSQQVWVEEGRAAAAFGGQAKQMEEAFCDIRRRMEAHARRYLSETEFQHVEEIMRAWRKVNPEVTTAEFIRLEAFTDALAHALVEHSDAQGLLARIEDAARDVERARLLGERALYLASRMPRLLQWYAQAAAADLLAQPELAETLASFKQLGALQRELPAQLKALESRLAAMPAELTGAAARQPELQGALANVEKTSQRMKTLEDSVAAIETAVTDLPTHLTQLRAATQPELLQDLAGSVGSVVARDVRSLILLAMGCALAVVILHALLRRWSHRPQRQD